MKLSRFDRVAVAVALRKHGTIRKAATALGVPSQTLTVWIKGAEARGDIPPVCRKCRTRHGGPCLDATTRLEVDRDR